ncbi:MAG: hypothetical protein IJT44_00410 [Clostridia bacterium]|nr:hypothetical protein [Clostridia bacterium]
MNKKYFKRILAVCLVLLFCFAATLSVSAVLAEPSIIAAPEFHLPLLEKIIAMNIPVISQIAAYVYSAIAFLYGQFQF